MQMIESAQARMEKKFSRFQAEVRQGQEEAASKAQKRACYEKPYSFKRKGTEVQATFNARLDKILGQPKCDIATIPFDPATAPACQRMVKSLRKGRVLIDERRKLILLADRLEQFNHVSIGWSLS